MDPPRPGRPPGIARAKKDNPSTNPYTVATRARRDGMTGFQKQLENAKRADKQAIENEIVRRKKVDPTWLEMWNAADKTKRRQIRQELEAYLMPKRVKERRHASLLQQDDTGAPDIAYWRPMTDSDFDNMATPDSAMNALDALEGEEEEQEETGEEWDTTSEDALDDDSMEDLVAYIHENNKELSDNDYTTDREEENGADSEDREIKQEEDELIPPEEDVEIDEDGDTNEAWTEKDDQGLLQFRQNALADINNIRIKTEKQIDAFTVAGIRNYWRAGWLTLETKLQALKRADLSSHESYFQCLPPVEQQALRLHVTTLQTGHSKGSPQWEEAQSLITWTPPCNFFVEREMAILQNLAAWCKEGLAPPGGFDWWVQRGPDEWSFVYDPDNKEAVNPDRARLAWMFVISTNPPNMEVFNRFELTSRSLTLRDMNIIPNKSRT